MPDKKSSKSQSGLTHAILTDLIAFKLIHLADLISRGAILVYEKEFGISNAELRALIALGEDQPLTIGDLSRRARIDKAWVSRAVKNLLDRGLLARKDHPTDSRMGLISLTDEGQRMVNQIAPVAWARQARLLEGLDETDIMKVINVLEKNADKLLHNP